MAAYQRGLSLFEFTFVFVRNSIKPVRANIMTDHQSALIDQLCDVHETSLRSGQRPDLRPIITQVDSAFQPELVRELLALELELLDSDVCRQRREQLCRTHPEFEELANSIAATENHAKTAATGMQNSGLPSDTIGPYKILRVIGEGGMGSVYLARQHQPVDRKVALKVIRSGLDSKQVAARFDAERQALAMMDHPSIARILDAGTTQTGQPYFAMEWIKGTPITQYCDDNKLSVPERLAIFREVCDAVQHAHQKGIIHRDLKPSNILIADYDGRAIPKIIDFGLAKALDAKRKLTDKTVFTELGQVIGTLKYMSPEQAGLDNLDIDTRSDIYSLGVILYELLTGSTPLNEDSLRDGAILKILELVRELEPPRPSSRFSDSKHCAAAVTERRRIDARRLSQILSGDLDWIVMKALEKDRSRRYESTSAFADDINNYLDNEPVSARPPSASYRIQKFVKKNRGPVTAAGIVLLAVFAGLIGTTYTALWAIRESNRSTQLAEEAVERAEQLQLISDFQNAQLSDIDVQLMGTQLYSSVVEKVPPDDQKNLQVALAPVNFSSIAATMLEQNLFDRTLQAIDRDFSQPSPIKARLLQTTATTMFQLGLLHAAVAPQRQALEIRSTQLGSDDPLTLESKENLGLLMTELGSFEEAEQLLKSVVAARQRLLGEDDSETWKAENNLGSLMLAIARFDEAERLYRKVLTKTSAVYGEQHEHTATANSNLALVLAKQDKPNEARKYAETALETRTALLGEDNPLTLTSLTNLGTLLMRQGNFADAEPILRQAVGASEKVRGDNHPDTLLVCNNLGACLTRNRKFDESEAVLQRTLEGRKKVLGQYHPHTASTLENLGFLYFQMGELENCKANLFETVQSLRTSLKLTHPTTVRSTASFANMLESVEDFQTLEQLLMPYRELSSAEEESIPPATLGSLLIRLGKAQLANENFQDHAGLAASLEYCHALLVNVGEPKSAPLRSCQQLLVEVYQAWDQVAPGAGHNESAMRWQKQLQAESID